MVNGEAVLVKRPRGHYGSAVHAKRHVVAVSFSLGFLARVAKFVCAGVVVGARQAAASGAGGHGLQGQSVCEFLHFLF